jgi:hypothetical protein
MICSEDQPYHDTGVILLFIKFPVYGAKRRKIA